MRRRWVAVAAVAVPGLVLGGIGFSHPTLLTAQSADWWATMHIVLVPLFPLLAVAVWVLLRDDRTAVGWGGRVAALVYVPFYLALDCISGIAAGTVTQAGADPKSEVVASLFATGRPLGYIGSYAFFVAVILVLASAWRSGSRGWMFFVAGAVALVSAYLFTTSHIYFPKGVIAMLGLALSFAVLEAIRRSQPAADREPTPSSR
jgi:hypothetical protein